MRFCDGSEDEERLNYLLELQTFFVGKLPDDGSFVPKHVAVGA